MAIKERVIKKAKKKDPNQIRKHLSDAEFWAVLRENGGLFARTARSIESQYGISYTRQAVKARVGNNMELYEDILEEVDDVADEGLQTLMRSGQPGTRLKAIEIYNKMRARVKIGSLEISASSSPDAAPGSAVAPGSLNLVIRVAEV